MPLSQPTYCNSRAFDFFSEQLPNLDSPAGLIDAASAIDMHVHGEADITHVHEMLESLAVRIENRYHSKRPEVIHAHAHEVLFEEEGFVGNALDYYHPDNALIPRVLQTRKGLPITLSLIYVSLMRRLGLKAEGIAAPGHFMASVEMSNGRVLIDPFHRGQLLHEDEARQRIESVTGKKLAKKEDPFVIATPKMWIARILQNLITIYRMRGQYSDMSAMIELQGLL